MKQKQCVAVICEYNPFHFGHKHQMDILKAEFETVVCIISGNIVQRGSAAIADKYLRAEAALKSGADLVVELPVPWCCSSARDFAAAGVHIAASIGVTHLAFGAEDSAEILCDISRHTETTEFTQRINEIICENKNLSYPQAFTEAVKQKLGTVHAEAVKKPNNILALEYLSALKSTEIIPVILKRNSEFASSSQIREKGEPSEILNMLPDESRAVFTRENGRLFPRDEKKLDAFFIGRLRQLSCEKVNFGGLYALPADLAHKILRSAQKKNTVKDIVAECTDKNYTAARIRRAINTLTFGITAKMVGTPPPYTAVLAVNKNGRTVIKAAKKAEKIKIVNKPARAVALGSETKSAYLFAKGIEDILYLAEPSPSPADTAKNPIIGE